MPDQDDPGPIRVGIRPGPLPGPGVDVVPTDAEREKFVGLLRDAGGKGALSVEEFESRIDTVGLITR